MDKTQLPSDDKIFIALTQANHSMIHMAIKASELGSGTKKKNCSVQFRQYTLVTFRISNHLGLEMTKLLILV